jgi:hypothetical protein
MTHLVFHFMNDINKDSLMIKPYYSWHMELDIKKEESLKNFNNLQSSLVAILSCSLSCFNSCLEFFDY